MQIAAMSSAMAGMRQASVLMDAAAAQIAQEGPVGVTVNATTPTSAMPSDGLMTSVPNLFVAGELFASNAFVARVAQDSYRAALDLYRPAS